MKAQSPQIACQRDLVYKANRKTLPVSVTIYVPTEVDADSCFICMFRIDGLGSKLDRTDSGSYTFELKGVDSAQGLTLALRTLQLVLKPHEASLSWLGLSKYHGFPLLTDISPDLGDDFRNHIEEMVQREIDTFIQKKFGPVHE